MITSAIHFAVGPLSTKDYRHFRIESNPPLEFEGAVRAGRALPGDIVAWDGATCRLQSRVAGPHSLFLIGTLEISSKTRYGMTSRGAPIYRFEPYDTAYPPFFVGCSRKDLSLPILVKIEFTEWPEESTCPRGVLVHTYGVAGDLKAEEDALLAHYGSARWKKGDLAEEDLIVPPLVPSPIQGPGFGTFHIDPPGCRDIDDAITLFRIDNDEEKYQLRIHIADVASWLSLNPDLAEKAEEIGQTLYKDGVAVRPMFPVELSEGHLSLLPGKLRAALSLVLEWKAGVGLLAKPVWSYDMICVTGSYTYEEAEKAPWADILAQITSDLAKKALSDSHEWIETLMLFYNQEAAKVLREHGLGVLRRHSPPDKARVLAAEEAGLPVELVAYSAGEYCSAKEENVAHWGIGSDLYCHASSPIRRWADCINQISLFQVLFKANDKRLANITESTIQSLEVNAKKGKKYERDLCYLRTLLNTNAKTQLHGVVLENGKLWIKEWKRLIRTDTKGLDIGSSVNAYIFHDSSKRNWKQRLVIRIH